MEIPHYSCMINNATVLVFYSNESVFLVYDVGYKHGLTSSIVKLSWRCAQALHLFHVLTT